MSKLDEQALRRPEWRGDLAVTLDDDQEWWLPKPKVRFGVGRDASGRTVLASSWSFGPSYLAKIEEFRDASSALGDVPEDDEGRVVAAVERLRVSQFELAIHLLLANYDLDFDVAARLMAFDFDDAEEAGRFAGIIRLAQGQSPKNWGLWFLGGLEANGVRVDGLDLDVASAAVEHLVRTGRMVPYDRFVPPSQDDLVGYLM